MKCSNSAAFNAQGSRVIIIIVQAAGASENICSSSSGCGSGRRQKERKTG
jgi:hypothetical protein